MDDKEKTAEKNLDVKIFTVQVPFWIIDEIDILAKLDNRSRNNMLVVILQEYVNAHK